MHAYIIHDPDLSEAQKLNYGMKLISVIEASRCVSIRVESRSWAVIGGTVLTTFTTCIISDWDEVQCYAHTLVHMHNTMA